MPLHSTVVDIDELAETLGRSADYIRRNWLKMHKDHGMPRKNPCGWVWPRGAMEAWLAAPELGGEYTLTSPDADRIAAQRKIITANQNARREARQQARAGA